MYYCLFSHESYTVDLYIFIVLETALVFSTDRQFLRKMDYL
jgi:hypothetical protein